MSGKAYDMSHLTDRYRHNIQESGIKTSESYTTQRLKIRLQNYFGNSAVFHKPDDCKKAELLYSSSISLQDVINSVFQLKKSSTKEMCEDEP